MYFGSLLILSFALSFTHSALDTEILLKSYLYRNLLPYDAEVIVLFGCVWVKNTFYIINASSTYC